MEVCVIGRNWAINRLIGDVTFSRARWVLRPERTAGQTACPDELLARARKGYEEPGFVWTRFVKFDCGR